MTVLHCNTEGGIGGDLPAFYWKDWFLPKDDRDSKRWGIVQFHGRNVSVEASEVPEVSGICYTPGYSTDRDESIFYCHSHYSAVRYLHCISLAFYGKVKFVLNGGVAYDTPHYYCPTCKKLVNVFDCIVDHDTETVLCMYCAGSVKTCHICDKQYRGEYCPNCFVEDVCAYCDVQGIHRRIRLNKSYASLCDKHVSVTAVTMQSYCWKPDSWTFRSVM